jgi:signal transduction histidine kinase
VSSDPADPRGGLTELDESVSAVLRRLALVWGGPCVLKAPYGNGGAAASSNGAALPTTLPLRADGEDLGALELARGTEAPTAQQEEAAQAVADALALALLAELRRQALEKECRAKDEIVAALAHDLRSPLNAITGWCHMLQTGSLGQEQHDNAIEIIARNARTQGQLIGDVADLARLLAGRLPLEWATVDAGAALQDAVKGLAALASSKHVTLEAVTPPAAVHVRADSERLSQVARLLLSHALKVSRQRGSVTARVTLREADVELTVETAGAGLATEALGALFEEHTAPGASRRPGSLALELARRLVLMQGGTIRAESDGAGTPLRLVARFPRVSA